LHQLRAQAPRGEQRQLIGFRPQTSQGIALVYLFVLALYGLSFGFWLTDHRLCSDAVRGPGIH
jgi:hypothetical protein